MYTQSKLILSNSSCIPLSNQLSALFGRSCATVIQQIHYWVKTGNDKIGKIHQGVRWIYNSYKAWQENIKSYSESTIYRAIRKLEKLGILKSDYLHDYKGNRTKWYTIDYEALEKMTRWSRQNDEIIYKDTKTTSKTVLIAETKIEENLVEEAKVALQEIVLDQLDSPPSLNLTIFSKAIQKRIKTHLGSIAEVKKYFVTIGNIPFLMGKKLMKSGDRWKLRIGWILSEKTLDSYIRKEKMFNVWPTKQEEKEREMPAKPVPTKLPFLSKEEAGKVAHTPKQRKIIEFLYDHFGEITYKSWFYSNNFRPLELKKGQSYYQIDGYAKVKLKTDEFADALKKAFEYAYNR